MITPVSEDRTLSCRECRSEFVFTLGEQEFYRQKGFSNEPTRCRTCRESRKKRVPGDLSPMSRMHGPHGNTSEGNRGLFSAVCSACSNQTLVPFKPAVGKPVYCRDCYHLRSRRRDVQPVHAAMA